MGRVDILQVIQFSILNSSTFGSAPGPGVRVADEPLTPLSEVGFGCVVIMLAQAFRI